MNNNVLNKSFLYVLGLKFGATGQVQPDQGLRILAQFGFGSHYDPCLTR